MDMSESRRLVPQGNIHLILLICLSNRCIEQVFGASFFSHALSLLLEPLSMATFTQPSKDWWGNIYLDNPSHLLKGSESMRSSSLPSSADLRYSVKHSPRSSLEQLPQLQQTVSIEDFQLTTPKIRQRHVCNLTAH